MTSPAMFSSVDTAYSTLHTNENAASLGNMHISPHVDATSETLKDCSAIRGVSSSNEPYASAKEVRFSNQVNVIKVPNVQLLETTNVSFSDDVVKINSPNRDTRDSRGPAKKRVRFSCLKHPKQPLSHGLTLLQMLKRSNAGSKAGMPICAKTHVRFGALKCQKNKYLDLSFGHRDSEWDEAETRRIFKRECMKHKALQRLSSMDDGEVEEEWDST